MSNELGLVIAALESHMRFQKRLFCVLVVLACVLLALVALAVIAQEVLS